MLPIAGSFQYEQVWTIGEEDFQTVCEVVEKMMEQSAGLITTPEQGR